MKQYENALNEEKANAIVESMIIVLCLIPMIYELHFLIGSVGLQMSGIVLVVFGWVYSADPALKTTQNYYLKESANLFE